MLEIHELARREAREAAEYYESRRTGLGDRFANALEEAFALITLAPLEQPPWNHEGVPVGVRHSLVRGFEFSIVFITEPRLVAVAIRHHAQSPVHWLGRLDEYGAG